MRNFRELKLVFIFSGILLILMLIKVTGNHGFPGDLQSTVDKASNRTFLISPEALSAKKEPVFLFMMDATPVPGELQKYPVIEINAGGTGRRDIIRKIKASEGLHVLIAGNQTEAMKAWVILSQVGIENLFVLDSSPEDQEQLKYRFQPDTTIRLELGVEVSNLQSE